MSLNCFGQKLAIEIYNKTGFDLDSVSIMNKYVGAIKKDSSTEILNFNELAIQDGEPFGFPHGTIKGKKKSDTKLGLCGTGTYNVTEGQFKFDITLSERVDGYFLFWNTHK